MKKEYLAPELEVVNLKFTNALLNASPVDEEVPGTGDAGEL